MKSLTCRQLIDFLDDYLAGTQPADVRAAFERHFGACEACRGFMASYRATVKLGKAVFQRPDDEVPAAVPEDLVRAVMAAAGKAPNRR
jgi:anti-sigma factor RsiW